MPRKPRSAPSQTSTTSSSKRHATSRDDLERFLIHGGFGQVWEEHIFHPTRTWRADWYLPEQAPPVIVEYDGLLGGEAYGGNVGHASISGILRDIEKLNAATALGIRCFRATARSVQDGSFFSLLDQVLERIPQTSRHPS